MIQSRLSENKIPVIICSNSGCNSSGGAEIYEYLNKEFNENNLLNDKWIIKKGGCHGFCEVGPTVIIGQEKVFYKKIDTVEKIQEIISSHLLNGNIVEKYLYFDRDLKKHITYYDDLPFIKKQDRLLLRDAPFTDPENIDDYINNNGFKALINAIDNYQSIDLCNMILDSGLRGRGGGGYFTGDKWLKQALQIAQPKYIICNGDEGDPGTFMDKYLLEGDPFRVLEGILIAGYATMSNYGIVYLRKEYNLADERIKNAIKIMYDKKYLGSSVLGRAFAFDIKIEYGPGAYISGEETALIASLESKRGTPDVKPPYPVIKGLQGKPTLINNVETFANIREIINLGITKYKEFGTTFSKGTKLFTLSGAVKNSGIIEVPFGTTLNYLVNDIAGGTKKDTSIKAVQVGGVSGGILPPSFFNETISFENLEKLESLLGSGGIVVFDEYTCIVEMARYYLEFSRHESCGFCTPCREGTQKILTILERIIDGKGNINDVEKINSISLVMYETSMCGLGRESINPVISMLKYFEDELKEHISKKKCRAGVCSKLVKYVIDKEKCIGCGICQENCPKNAISGIKNQYFTIDKEDCIRCGVCFKLCPSKAIFRS